MVGHGGPENKHCVIDHSKGFFYRFPSSRHLAGCRCLSVKYHSSELELRRLCRVNILAAAELIK